MYTPAPRAVIFAMVGLCKEEVNELGPVQLQVRTSVAAPVRVNVLPTQIGSGLADALTPVGTVIPQPQTKLAVAVPEQLPEVKETYRIAPALE